jgi:hypothetical protein
MSFLTPVGTVSGSYSIVWLIFTAMVAGFGFKKMALRGFYLLSETFIDLGMMYIVVGGAWLTASRYGYELLGFSPFIVILTAVHFHLAGFGLSIFVGQVLRKLESPSRIALISGLLISLTPIMVAIGINSYPVIEVIMSFILAVSVMLFSICTLKYLKNLHCASGIKIVLGISLCVPFISMLMALGFALGEFLQVEILSYDQMIYLHGKLNYFGFLLPSYICLLFVADQEKNNEVVIPFQELKGRLFIGNDYLQGDAETGLYKNFNKTFHLESFDFGEGVLNYFEKTNETYLECQARWEKGFRVLGKLVHHLGHRMGQLVLPLHGSSHVISNKLFRLKNSVGSLRTFADSSPMYVTSYSIHHLDTVPYMNISLPIPFGQLHSILFLKGAVQQNKTRLILTSRSLDPLHTGLWLEVFSFRIKIPLRETLDMWNENGVGIAIHRFWIFGIKCLELDYKMILRGN